MNKSTWTIAIALSATAATAAVWAYNAKPPQPSPQPASVSTAPSQPEPEPVGSQVCAGCHPDEAGSWSGSDHHLAMQPATGDTVLGDFDDAVFEHNGDTTTFTRRGEGFVIRTAGPGGEVDDFEVRYTFGVRPLQQYLLDGPRGRLQAFDVAWDSRDAAEGGQRWYALFEENPLDWWGPSLNWNHMCAECHATGLQKGFQVESDAFDTTWDEVGVGCEACHGPGSNHTAIHRGRSDSLGTGLVDTREPRQWTADAIRPHRDPARPATAQVDTCGRCHARRAPITADADGQILAQAYHATLIEPGIYHPDGQILEEDYVWGSFRQSRMYAAGVVCTDCHDAHSGAVAEPVSATCTRCHESTTFASPDHHFHPSDSSGAACVACHMPATTYMGVDPRRDHSLRLPWPEQSASLNTPDVCTGCHTDRDLTWAVAVLQGRRGVREPRPTDPAVVLAAAWASDPTASPRLVAIANDPGLSGILRATALMQLSETPAPGAGRAAIAAASNRDPVVREAAFAAMTLLPLLDRLRQAAPGLTDPITAVRFASARTLAPLVSEMTQSQRRQFDAVAVELRAGLAQDLDRPEAWLDLSLFALSQGLVDDAEDTLRSGLDRFTDDVPMLVNLADVCRARGDHAEAVSVLQRAVQIAPEVAVVHYALGLAQVRVGRMDAAIAALQAAARLDPHDPRFSEAVELAKAAAP